MLGFVNKREISKEAVCKIIDFDAVRTYQKYAILFPENIFACCHIDECSYPARGVVVGQNAETIHHYLHGDLVSTMRGKPELESDEYAGIYSLLTSFEKNLDIPSDTVWYVFESSGKIYTANIGVL